MSKIHLDSWPEGLYLYSRVYSPKQCDLLYETIDSMEYSTALNRPVQHYGFAYEYTIKEPQTRKLMPTRPAPTFMECIGDALYDTGLLRSHPNQFIVNKYRPGEGIGGHRDHHPIFDYDVATLSLGSDIVMTFRPYPLNGSTETIDVLLTVGSILVFGGDARYNWSHEIAKRKSDTLDGKRVPRGDRISVTFRRVNPEYMGVEVPV